MHNRLIGRVVVVDVVAEEVNGSIAGIKIVELNRCIMVCNKGEREPVEKFIVCALKTQEIFLYFNIFYRNFYRKIIIDHR